MFDFSQLFRKGKTMDMYYTPAGFGGRGAFGNIICGKQTLAEAIREKASEIIPVYTLSDGSEFTLKGGSIQRLHGDLIDGRELPSRLYRCG